VAKLDSLRQNKNGIFSISFSAAVAEDVGHAINFSRRRISTAMILSTTALDATTH
jgi:hypothetical protein